MGAGSGGTVRISGICSPSSLPEGPRGIPPADDRRPARRRRARRRRVASYVALTKPRIIELLLVTTVPVMFLAEGGVPSLWLVAGAPSSAAP